MVSQRNDRFSHRWKPRHRVSDLNINFSFSFPLINFSESPDFFYVLRYAIVEELAGFGAVVHTCGRSQKELDQCLQQWKSRRFTVTGSVCDLFYRDQREKLMETVSSLFQGKLNILVSVLGSLSSPIYTLF